MVGILSAVNAASRLKRARDLGFDVDNPVYHGTSADNIEAFDDSKIGDRDDGFFGRGHYFADSGSEARYYGPNVNKYYVRGKMLNLDPPSSIKIVSPNFEREKFKYQMGKLAEIDALDEPQSRGLQAVKDLEKWVDENVIVGPGVNADGSEGFHVRVPKPFLTKYPDGSTQQEYVSPRPARGRLFNPDRKEAIENLKNKILYDILTNYDNTFSNKFKDVNLAMLSLSDYVRQGGLGSAKLTEKAKEAGYDGIKVADETVVFDPKNIRQVDAQFDPAKTDSSNVLASGAPVAAGLLGAAAMQPEEAEAATGGMGVRVPPAPVEPAPLRAAMPLAPTTSEKAQGVLDAIVNMGQATVAPISNAPHTLIQALTSDRPTAQVRAGQQQRLDAMDYQPGELGQQYTDDLARLVADQINQSQILDALGNSRILRTPINAIQQLPDRARLVGGSILDALPL